MNKAYFKNIRNEIVKLLDNAHKQVAIAMAWFTSAELFECLKSCISRGVFIQLILLDDEINWMPYSPDFNELSDIGASIRLFNPANKFMHNKFCIIDNEIAITGSYNWTYYAEVRNLENIVILNNQTIVNQYIEQFYFLWEQAIKGNKFPRLSFEDIVIKDNINLVELNQEIQIMEQVRNLPQKVDIKLKSAKDIPVYEKLRIENLDSFSTANIGLHVKEEDDDTAMFVMIPKGKKLPYRYNQIFFNYPDSRNDTILSVLCGDSTDVRNNKLLIEKRLDEIVGNSTIEELKIEIEFSLNEKGYLEVIVKCKQTSKTLEVTTLNPELAKYGNK